MLRFSDKTYDDGGFFVIAEAVSVVKTLGRCFLQGGSYRVRRKPATSWRHRPFSGRFSREKTTIWVNFARVCVGVAVQARSEGSEHDGLRFRRQRFNPVCRRERQETANHPRIHGSRCTRFGAHSARARRSRIYFGLGTSSVSLASGYPRHGTIRVIVRIPKVQHTEKQTCSNVAGTPARTVT